MANHLAKQSPKDNDLAGRTVGPSAFQAGAIERATDLGGGYMLVKIAASDLPVASNEVQLPVVPQNQVRKLLARLNEAVTAKPPVTHTAPEDNTAVLDALEDQALARRQQLRDKGELLTSSEICARLGISRQALSKAVRDRRMFWLDGHSGAQWYPGFFADASTSRRDLEAISLALADLPGAMKWQFFTTPKHSLQAQTPLAAIRHGKVDDVIRTAREVVERNLGR